MTAGRQLAHAARQLAREQKAQAAATPAADRRFFATVTTVTPGGGADGQPSASVTYQGTETLAGGGYLPPYTPVLNDWVACVYVGDQVLILGKPSGAP